MVIQTGDRAVFLMATDPTNAFDLRLALGAVHRALNIDSIGWHQIGMVAASTKAGLALDFDQSALEQLFDKGVLGAHAATAIDADSSKIPILTN